MIYVKNLPWWERVLRLGVGTAVAAYAFAGRGGLWEWVLLAAGAGVALTGIIGFCPACALAGRRLLQKRLPPRGSSSGR